MPGGGGGESCLVSPPWEAACKPPWAARVLEGVCGGQRGQDRRPSPPGVGCPVGPASSQQGLVPAQRPSRPDSRGLCQA